MHNSNSGDLVQFIGEGLVTKTFKSDVICRNSLNKQLEFFNFNQIRSLSTPKIINTNGPRSFTMQRILGSNGAEIYNSINVSDLNSHLSNIFELVTANIESSQLVQVPAKRFIEKIDEISERCQRSIFQRFISDAYTIFDDDLKCHVGQCHGDLTLSNIIIKDDKLWLIDFISAFIETPYWDIAKLYQEFQFGWSIRHSTERNMLRYKLQNKYITHFIDELVISLELSPQVIARYKYLTLLRITPYIQDTITENWLLTSLQSCSEELS